MRLVGDFYQAFFKMLQASFTNSTQLAPCLLRSHSFAYLMGAVWLRCDHQDFGGLRYRHHSSQSKPWADSGYSSISKVSYLMLSKEGDTTRVRSSFIRCRIGSALSGSRTSAACVKKKKREEGLMMNTRERER